MSITVATLHTGRRVQQAYLWMTLNTLDRLLSEVSTTALMAADELTRLAARYLAEGRTGPVYEPEAREALPFSYDHMADLMPTGKIHQMTMDILAATLANPTDSSYDLLNPLTGVLVERRALL
jgi:hypothetical protein